MINWETIKSLYNDKPTLMEWLKKVEAALNGATLTSVSVNTISVGVISLTFNFDDGTSITTPNINLPQGAQGVSVTSASIVNNELILGLSNGQSINAGNLFNGNVNITGNLSVDGSGTFLGNLRSETAIGPMENIIDNQGYKRFREWEGTHTEAAGLHITFCKCSLSGSHIMFAIAGSLDNGAVLTGYTVFGNFILPAWIWEKILPVWAGSAVEVQDVKLWGDDYSTQSISVIMQKISGNAINIQRTSSDALTITANRGFRMQFDLLIDAA